MQGTSLLHSALALALFGALACGGRSKDRRTIILDETGGMAAAGGLPATGGAGGRSGGASNVAGTGGSDGGVGGEPDRQPCKLTEANARDGLELVTLSLDCRVSDGDAAFSRLTPDGRYVAFDSEAGDLVANDLNGRSDGFLFDLETRELELISKRYGGDDPAQAYTWLLVPSDDARYVAFTAMSYELTAGTPPEGIWVYLRDREAATTRRFAASYACTYWVDMSGDARFIVAEGFSNCQGGLEEGDHDTSVEYDLETNETRYFEVTDGGQDNYRPAISRDGRFVLWATRPPGTRGQYVSQLELFDRTLDTTTTLPLFAFNYESTDLSDSGDVIAFGSGGQIYRYVIGADELALVSANSLGEEGDDFSEQASLSGDGRYLVFRSSSTNLVDDDTNGVADIFLFDAMSGALERVSVAGDGSQSDDDSRYPFVSGDGSKVSFSSKARNLLPLATSGDYQLYVRTLTPR
ncbi:MAG TPA: hypothetical protein VFZ53_10925 [Polyangiaceae bacterium]